MRTFWCKWSTLRQVTTLASLDDNWTAKKWKPMAYGLANWKGKKVQIRFNFNTSDCVENGTIGAFIDDVSVSDIHCSFAGCDDGNPCTKGTCAPATGKCSQSNVDGGACDDGELCTEKEACAQGKCVGTAALGKACDDGVLCTDKDACDKDAKCVGAPAVGKACDDGVLCTDKDACDKDAKCVGAPAVGKTCDDGVKCTVKDACDTNGGCTGTGKCDDGNSCTIDSCSSSNGFCSYSLSVGACEDGNLCSLGDTCDKGACIAGKATDCDDGKPCTTDACDAKTGLCKHTPVANCAVKCASDAECADDDPCTANACDTKTGKCSAVPAVEGSICGAAATCVKGTCTPVDPVDGWAVKLSGYGYGQHMCALLKNKTVACWGDNIDGQLGDGKKVDSGKPVAVVGLKNIVDVSAGYRHTCAVSDLGRVYCWGRNTYYETGASTTPISSNRWRSKGSLTRSPWAAPTTPARSTKTKRSVVGAPMATSSPVEAPKARRRRSRG